MSCLVGAEKMILVNSWINDAIIRHLRAYFPDRSLIDILHTTSTQIIIYITDTKTNILVVISSVEHLLDLWSLKLRKLQSQKICEPETYYSFIVRSQLKNF